MKILKKLFKTESVGTESIRTGPVRNETGRRALILILSLGIGLLPGAGRAEAVEVLNLYDGPIPGARPGPDLETIRDPADPNLFLMHISRPTLSLYLPDPALATGAAVIICPGGSYRGVSIAKEGYKVAEAFNAIGVAAFVLKYRNPDDRTMEDRSLGPLQDLQQAIARVRAGADQWQVDPDRLGVMGFSAGGHLAATAATRFDRPAAPFLANKPLRPDFLVLAYPVISMMDGLTHQRSRSNLLGDAASRDTLEYFSAERQVSPATPPAFLVHAGDDTAVKVQNSLRFYEALADNGVAASLHVFTTGGHGFGLVNKTVSSEWFPLLHHWLLDQGWLTSKIPPGSPQPADLTARQTTRLQDTRQ